MTIYVDDMFMSARVGRTRARWCHMFSDVSIAELDAFAVSIGMDTVWCQYNHGFVHYDVTEAKRLRAIHSGAVPIAYRDLPDYLYRLNPPGTRRQVTTFLTEGLACQRSATVESQQT
jgi:uncharacterized protein DUF4031